MKTWHERTDVSERVQPEEFSARLGLAPQSGHWLLNLSFICTRLRKVDML